MSDAIWSGLSFKVACRVLGASLPAPYYSSSNAVVVAFALPRLALQCFALEAQRRPVWLAPWFVFVALLKTLWGTVGMPSAMVAGQLQVCH